MALADFHVVREDVPMSKGKLSVRGLALDDIAILIRENLSDLDDLLHIYGSNADDRVAISETAKFAINLVRETPALVAKLIALACDEPDSEHLARKLPIPVQVEAIKKVVDLTFREAGGVKNFMESLTNLLGAVRPVPSLTGSNI